MCIFLGSKCAIVQSKSSVPLLEKAWQQVKSSDASVSEPLAALAVTTAMKAKTAVGGGSRRRKRKIQCRRKVSGRGTRKRRNNNKRKKCSACSKKSVTEEDYI